MNRSLLIPLLLALWPGVALPQAVLEKPAPWPELSTYGQQVQMTENRIWNSLSSLTQFYAALAALERGQRDRVTIVHLGDSHVQADWFSGSLRMALQARFGNAGRGLVFPHDVIGTNGAEDLQAHSGVRWEHRRCGSTRDLASMPVGVGGYLMRSTHPQLDLVLAVDSNDWGLDYAFDRVTLFTEKGEQAYHLIASQQPLLPDGNREAGGLGWRLDLGLAAQDPFRSSFRFSEPASRLYLYGQQEQARQQSLGLYGLVLEQSASRGILYHSIGANGAQARHFLQEELFLRQLAQLQPDLVIVSFGTNEAFAGDFRPGRFSSQMSDLLTQLSLYAPEADFLLTGPPDTRKNGGVNHNIRLASLALVELALSSGYAAWDFQSVMGGEGSNLSWQRVNLAFQDGVHLTKPGYQLQAHLLFQALMDSYGRYRILASD